MDRVPEELWTEVHTIVEEVVNKTIPKKKNQEGEDLTKAEDTKKRW